MKKIYLALALCSLAVSALCQTSVEVIEQNVHGKTVSTLIKEYDYPKTITCVNTSEETATFILSDQTMQTVEVTVDNIYVCDMDISFDTVFFCGRTWDNPYVAIIGFLDVNEAFYGSGNVYIHTGIYAGTNSLPVEELTRLVTYRSSDLKRHIVCIGRTLGELKYPCIVDMTPDDIMGYTTCGYQAGYIKDVDETFSDIEVVPGNINTYLVTSGFVDFQGQYLNIRAYAADNIFIPSGPQDMRHIFCIDTVFATTWFGEDALLTYIEPNVFATVSYLSYSDPFLPNGDNRVLGGRLHVASYDLSLLLGGSLYSMTGNVRTTTVTLTDPRLKRFIYRPRSKTLAFLESAQSRSMFTELEYYPVGAFSPMRTYFDNNKDLSDMSLYNIGSFYTNYVMSGHFYDQPGRLVYKMETFQQPAYCSDPVEYLTQAPNPLASVNKVEAFSSLYNIAWFRAYETDRVEVPIVETCEDGSKADGGSE